MIPKRLITTWICDAERDRYQPRHREMFAHCLTSWLRLMPDYEVLIVTLGNIRMLGTDSWLDARIAEGNIRIANCSTPAQFFHLLRLQALGSTPRPLVIFTPKSLLRLKQATSKLDELTSGGFRPVFDDPRMTDEKRAAVRKLLLCSGKVYYDIVGHSTFAILPWRASSSSTRFPCPPIRSCFARIPR